MSTILDRKANGMRFHIEKYESAMEVVDKARSREITDRRFDDKSKEAFGAWEGVGSYEEALNFMRNGYQPTVESMRGVFKTNRAGERKRFAFQNSVQGFAPVVPLALKRVPNCMIDMQMRPIKSKVLDIYYDMTANCGTDSAEIIKAGQNMLGAIVELESQGYRFNLYACQTYADRESCDMLVVKVKDAARPLDLKRISFPLTHTAFFRVIGFDWYSRVPGGEYRGGYGTGLAYLKNNNDLQQIASELFRGKPIYFSGAKIIGEDKQHIKEVLTNDSKA